MTATSSRAVSAVGLSSGNHRAPPPPIFSSHNDQHPRAVEPYRQQNPGTTGNARATIGKQPDPHRWPKGSSPTHGKRSTRLVTAHHHERAHPTNPTREHDHNATSPRRTRTDTAAPNRPADRPRFFPPCNKNVTPRTAPVGKQTRQDGHAPAPNSPRRADDRRPSAPTT